MIYGDNPAKDNPTPDMNAIKQSGNLYLYCADNPVCFVDKDGCKLAFPGEIHRAVQNRIVYRMAVEGKQLYQEVGVFSNGNYIGRADLAQESIESMYIWEVKPNKPMHIRQGIRQIQGYCCGDYLKGNIKRYGDISPGYYIAGETFRYRGVFDDYMVTYRSIGNGIITYDYTAIEKKKVEIKAQDVVAVTAVITLIVLGVILTANGIPVIVFA